MVKWQEVTVDPKGAGHTYRLEVPGGWLYRTVSYRFPTVHSNMEDGYCDTLADFAETKEELDVIQQMYRDGQEIATQTTVFVPTPEPRLEQEDRLYGKPGSVVRHPAAVAWDRCWSR